MTLAIALSVVIFIIGFGLYMKASNPKWVEVGRIMFGVGLLASLLQLHGGIALNLFK